MSSGGGITLEWLIGKFADAVVERLDSRDEGLIDQRDRRGLMGRRHIEAVRRRMTAERGLPEHARTAFQRGRDYLLTPAAAREELARGGGGSAAASAPSPVRAPRRGSPRTPKGEGRKSSARDEAAAVKRELETAMRRVRET